MRIPNQLKIQIFAMPFPSCLDRDDGWVWHGSSSRVFSVGSAYSWLLEHSGKCNADDDWSWVWRVNGPEKKIKILLWLMLNDSLPTN